MPSPKSIRQFRKDIRAANMTRESVRLNAQRIAQSWGARITIGGQHV